MLLLQPSQGAGGDGYLYPKTQCGTQIPCLRRDVLQLFLKTASPAGVSLFQAALLPTVLVCYGYTHSVRLGA